MDNNELPHPPEQSPEALQEQQKKMLEDMVMYLRDLLKSRTKDFVLFRLDEIAATSQMEHSLKLCIIKAIEEPDKPFIVNFKLKEAKV